MAKVISITARTKASPAIARSPFAHLVDRVILLALKGPDPLAEPAKAIKAMRRRISELKLPLSELAALSEPLRAIAYRYCETGFSPFENGGPAAFVPHLGCTRREYTDAAQVAFKGCVAEAATRRLNDASSILTRLALVLGLPGAIDPGSRARVIRRLSKDVASIVEDLVPWHAATEARRG